MTKESERSLIHLQKCRLGRYSDDFNEQFSRRDSTTGLPLLRPGETMQVDTNPLSEMESSG